jgi:hypothetical protein
MADLVRRTFSAGFSYNTLVADLENAAAGQTVPDVDSKDFLVVQNNDASPKTLTLEEKEVCSFGHAAQDLQVSIAAGEIAIITPANHLRFRDGTTKKMELTWSATTSVKVGLFRWPK